MIDGFNYMSFKYVYFLFINVLGMFYCAFDKYLAIKSKMRISEKILLIVCSLGGVYGFYLMSRLVRHKTSDKLFLIFMYPILFIWIGIVILSTLC